MTIATPPARWRRGLGTGLNLVTGIALSIVPPAVLSISSNTFGVADQGLIAVAVSIATFVAQLVFGATVEARLATPGAGRVHVPPVIVLVGALGALALIPLGTNPWAVAILIPLVFTALEVGRGVSVAEHLVRRETIAGVALGLGAAGGVLGAIAGSSHGFSVLAAGSLIAIIARWWRSSGSHGGTTDGRVRAWVVADVALTGLAFPLLNSLLLVLVGPAAATLFAAVSTVSGLLAIPSNYLRVRLLRRHAALDVVVTALALVGAVGVIAVGEFSGLFGVAFGDVWISGATGIALVTACLWRITAMLSALPFAALRRAGRARTVMILRGVSAAITFGLATAAATSHTVWLVFAALAVGEFLLAVICEAARRRGGVALADPTPDTGGSRT